MWTPLLFKETCDVLSLFGSFPFFFFDELFAVDMVVTDDLKFQKMCDDVHTALLIIVSHAFFPLFFLSSLATLPYLVHL